MMAAADGDPQSTPISAGRLGMALLIASLSMLFAASLMGYLVIRSRAPVWPPPGMPALPTGLWISTIVLILSSLTIHFALSAIRKNRRGELRIGLLITFILGVVFLAGQSVNWVSMRGQLLAQTVPDTAKLYVFTFYLLTVLHGVHVIGGLIPLGVVTLRSFKGRYTPEYHPGVLYCSMYWHFLDVVWLILFVSLVVAG